MTTWSPVPKHKYGVSFGEGFFGYGLFGGGDAWTTVSADGSTWTQAVQSGTVAAMFELNEPLGGPEWSTVSKDE